MYLADSAYLDSISLVQVEAFRPHNQVVAPEYEKALHLKPLDPQSIHSGPIAHLEYAFFEMYFGGGGFGQDFYHIHRAEGKAE
jgi:hypothetical protein